MIRALRSPEFRYSIIVSSLILGIGVLFPNFFRSLLSPEGFLPHSTCYLQNPRMIALHVISDSFIGLAYVSISCTLAFLVFKATRDIPFHWMFLAFGIFIISCGFTHFMEIWTVWQSVYWLAGYVKVVTAVASVITAIALFPLVPKVFRLINSVKISEQRRLELIQAHADLERSNANLCQQKAELEAANQELEMFTYSVAHDLRAPLRTMQSFSNVLIEDYANKLDGDAKIHLHRIEVSAAKMQGLLNDLLKYSRVSRTEMPLHPVDVKEALDQALTAVKIEVEARKARISVAGQGFRVVGNTSVLGQIISNLISNAIKFVPADATPDVCIMIEQTGEYIRISVRDNGIGIPEEHQTRIFKIFERLHTDAEYPGTGIGLAIVQRATDKMGGRVGLQSAPGRGSTFWIELPKA